MDGLGQVKVKVLLVDDHPMFRDAVRLALESEPDLEVVGQAGSSCELLELLPSVEPDVAVVDVLLPVVSGLTIVAQLRERKPFCRVLGLSGIVEPGLIADMLRAGAAGYAVKTQPRAEIVDAIRCVHEGERYLPPCIATEAIEADLQRSAASPIERMTPREREVFELVIRGHSNDEIASELFISRRTVETHRQRITRKLSARSVIDLQRIVAQYGLRSA